MLKLFNFLFWKDIYYSGSVRNIFKSVFSLDLSDSNNIEELFDFEIEVSEVKVVFCCLCL